jgi:hypothetical protein
MKDPRETFLEDGFLHLQGGIPPDVLGGLRRGLAPLLAERDSLGERPTRYQTILEPRYFHSSFVDFLNLEATNEAAMAVIGDGPMFAGLACLLGCAEHVFCRWHRDTVSTAEVELSLLLSEHPTALVQSNCAVYDDASLWVVPGSHRRPDTEAEAACGERFAHLDFVGPMAAATALETDVFAAMPGAVHVHLAAGDCLLYNPLLWHAAEYRPQWKRCTLHGGWKDPGLLDRFELLRWGLGHNPWLLKPDYLGDPGPYLTPQLRRYQEAVRRYAPEPAA